jgi:hypothetical protein
MGQQPNFSKMTSCTRANTSEEACRGDEASMLSLTKRSVGNVGSMAEIHLRKFEDIVKNFCCLSRALQHFNLRQSSTLCPS